MLAVNPYLNFNGTTEEAFNLYKKVFGGEFAMIQRFKETPEAGKVPEGAGDKIMHIALPIGKNNMLMGTDALENMGQPPLKMGNNFYITINAESKEQADKIFNGLSDNGKVQMPMDNTFWGAYFGMVADSYGVQWMISYDANRSAQN
jgi:PhnB protein